MKKSLSFLVGLSMMASALPVMAESSSSSSSSSVSSSMSSSSSISSSSSSSWMSSAMSAGPCADKKQGEKVICLRNYAKAKAGQKSSERQNTIAHERNALCKEKTGLQKALCLRRAMIKKTTKVMEKMEKNMDKRMIRFKASKRASSKSSSSSSN